MSGEATDPAGAGTAAARDPHRHGQPRTWLSAAALLIGALTGLAVMVALVRLVPRDAEGAGLGLDTHAVVEPHPRGEFHFPSVTASQFLTTVKQFDGLRPMLWLGASQVFGINGYRKPQHNVAYRVFDTLLDEQTAMLALTFALASPQEHDVMVQHLLPKVQLSGLVIGAAFGDMRHAGLRTSLTHALDDPDTRARLEETEHGRRLVAEALAERGSAPVSRAKDGDTGLVERTEDWITGRLEDWFGLEDFRRAARAWVLLELQEVRRTLESLRARYTRDLSRYRLPMLEQNYQANWAAWRHMLATAKALGVPVLIYIAPRPTDFFPFDPETYARFKRDLAALAAENGAAFVDIEDAVPNQHWGMVDIGFGFYARDPFHFTAEGHALMANALLPHIRRHLIASPVPR